MWFLNLQLWQKVICNKKSAIAQKKILIASYLFAVIFLFYFFLWQKQASNQAY